MASTTPASSISTSTLLLSTAGIAASAALAYAVYFDYRRRTDPNLRKMLKKERKKLSKLDQESAKAAENDHKVRVERAVQMAKEEGFPSDSEETEHYFMEQVTLGEQMISTNSDPVEVALCFYRALKVYPQPQDLISIYSRSVPKVSVIPLE